jgi:hypothetical protein
MQDPAPPEKNPFACPACSSPVKPGDKFCEACGAKIPALFTCTKCGTQFVHFKEQCELCGGPLVLGDGSVPGTPAQPAQEEKTVTVKRAVAEPSPDEVAEESGYDSPQEAGDGEVIPIKKRVSHRHAEPEEEPEEVEEPEQEDVPEQDEEGEPEEEDDEPPAPVTRPARKKAEKRSSQEIVEPDTDELLELYGKEYDPDETLGSHHRSPGVSRKERAAERPAAAPVSPAKRPGVKVDDALLLSPDRPQEKKAQKPRAGRSGILVAGLAAAVIVAAVIFIALPSLISGDDAGSQSSVTVIEDTPALTRTPTATPTPTRAGALIPQPTQTIPSGQKLYFQVQKSPITTRIVVTFAGSAGHGSIKSADVKVTHPDGSVATGMLQPLKGITEIILDGSTGTDRVEIIALMSDGTMYRVYDELVAMMD